MDPQMAGLIVFMMGSGFLFVVATLFCWHTLSLGLLALAPWMRRTSSWVAFGGLGTAIAVGLMASAAVTERIARRRSGDH
jgi:hypothetical protein